MKIIIILLALVAVGLYAGGAVPSFGFEALYAKTPVGTVEVKTLPPRLALTATRTGSYFQQDNRLFSTLFGYIQRNNVSMTVPVEAEMEQAEMRFFAAGTDAARELTDDAGVTVESVDAREVVSVGLSGAYTESGYEAGRQQLEAWLVEHPQYCAAGPAYAVYWNGPYVPNLFKRSEVHLTLTPADQDVAGVQP